MDGLSVIASVTGILSAAAKVAMVVTKFIEKERDAPHSMRKVWAEVTDLSNCLTQLSPFIVNNENVPTARKAAISVEHIIATNTSCVLTLSELEEILDSFQLDQPMAAGNRMRWAWHQEKIESILVRLRASKSSLNLILTIFTCTTLSEIQSSISNLNTTVQAILANSKDMPRRMASIKTTIARLSRYATSTSGRPTDPSDDASTIRPASYNIENDILSSPGVGHTIMSQFGIEIQKELEASRVYQRTAERHSMSSYLSGLHSAAGSALSGVSLAEISVLSLLSLPISYDELWNPQHYIIAREPHDLANSSNTNALYPLNTQGVGVGMAREGLSDTWRDGVDINRIKSPSLSPGSLNTSISGVRDSAANIKAANSATNLPTSLFETPASLSQAWDVVKTACRSPMDPTQAPFQIVDSEVTMRPQINIILLGARCSGISTVFEQMNLRWSGSLCDVDERKEMGQFILVKMIRVFNKVIENMRHVGIKYQREDSLQHAKFLKLAGAMAVRQIQPLNCLCALKGLWGDEAVQTALSRGLSRGVQYGNYHDNLDYDIQNIDRYLSRTYTPSDDDILHHHFGTSKTIETSSIIDDVQYHVLDAGIHLRSERKKVIHGLARRSGFHCLIYTVPLNGYYKPPIFGRSANRILESRYEFASDCLYTDFTGTTIILLFTHLDLFEAQIRKIPFKDHFPDYTGKQDDSIAIREFVAQNFRNVRNGVTISRIFFANATDTKEFSAVLSQIEDIMKTRCREEQLHVAESDDK